MTCCHLLRHSWCLTSFSLTLSETKKDVVGVIMGQWLSRETLTLPQSLLRLGKLLLFWLVASITSIIEASGLSCQVKASCTDNGLDLLVRTTLKMCFQVIVFLCHSWKLYVANLNFCNSCFNFLYKQGYFNSAFIRLVNARFHKANPFVSFWKYHRLPNGIKRSFRVFHKMW